mgnify:CR=1 FL=1
MQPPQKQFAQVHQQQGDRGAANVNGGTQRPTRNIRFHATFS